MSINDKEKSLTEQIKEALIAGTTREELVAAGFNPGSVRVCYSELKKKGLVDTGKGEAGKMQIYARGSPAEAIIQGIEVPEGKDLEGFTQGVRFGMSLLVVGVRLAQEMSTIGVQQAKPLVTMAREMRAGEKEAGEIASQDAAVKVGGMLMGELGPRLGALEGKVDEAAKPRTGNPMMDMFARVMEPMMKNMMSMMPGMGGTSETAAPSGWTVKDERKQEEPQKEE